MGTPSCTVAGVSYPIKNDHQIKKMGTLEVRSILTITLIDLPGTAMFSPRDPVVLTDSVMGVLYTGYVSEDQQTKYGPANTAVDHLLTCYDKQHLFDKRSNSTNYLGWYAGDIAVDFVESTLVNEGVTVAASLHRDTTVADFNTGILSGVAGYTPTTTSDGELELLKAGSDLTITEATTADFATGTPTSVVATNNTLTPTTQQALLLKSTLAGAITTGAYVNVQIWTGSMVVGTLDTLYYGVWCSSASRESVGGIELYFSDGTVLSAITSGIIDQNGLHSYGDVDLSAYAKDQWYNRVIALPSTANGKTITGVALNLAGHTAGPYTVFFKNIYLGSHSGSPFFSTTATTPQSTPSILSTVGYAALPTSTTVVTTFDPVASSRISTAHSIDAVKLLKSSTVTWYDSGTAVIAVSYDGVSYQPCTNNAALPALPVGSNIAGLSLTIKETFTAATSTTLSAPDPTSIPFLDQVNILLYSAPNATKSDVVKPFETQADWNTGTYSGTASTSGGDLTAGVLTRDWNDGLITNQIFVFTYVDNGSGPVQKVFESVASGAYTHSLNVDTDGTSYFGMARFDFAGLPVDFTIDCDVLFNPLSLISGFYMLNVGVVYRTNLAAFANSSPVNPFSFGYCVRLDGQHIELGYGSNTSATNSYFTIQSVTRSFSANTFYHLKIVVSGNHHLIYVANEANPTINAVDNTYTTPGYVGFRSYGGNSSSSMTCKIDNFTITPNPTGTWQGPGTSISSLSTCGPSVISWAEVNTASQSVSFAQVSTSVDGGSTFQLCTNGSAIPNLPSGTNVSGKSVITKVAFNTISQTFAPIVRQLVWRVLGQYPTVTGTRTTAPMALDTMVRANQSGLGTSTDGQTYTITGTGTPSIASNHALVVSTGSDTHASPGTRTGTDEDIYCQVNIGSTGDICGIEGRYSAASGTSAYKLLWYSGALHINKSISGANVTLATSSAFTMTPGTWYVFHLRITGSTTASLQGRAWQVGTLEPTTWNVTATD